MHPFKDDKILTDWNGLMIAALAKAGSALEREDWILAARRAAGFAVAKLRDPKTGRLFKRSRAGQAGLPGLLEDYAFLTWGLIELHQATQDPTYLRTALELTDLGLEFFWDQEAGGFWHSPSDGEALLLQSKEAYDGAIPSGNSVMLLNLVRLARLTGRTAYEERAQELVDALGGQVLANPSAHTQFLMGLDFLIGPTQEIVVVGDPLLPATKDLTRCIHRAFLPSCVWLLRPLGENPPIADLAPFAADLTTVDGAPAAYVCTHFACQAPVTRVEALQANLGLKPAASASGGNKRNRPIASCSTNRML